MVIEKNNEQYKEWRKEKKTKWRKEENKLFKKGIRKERNRISNEKWNNQWYSSIGIYTCWWSLELSKLQER